MTSGGIKEAFLVHGSDSYRREKFVRLLSTRKRQEGWSILEADGTDRGLIEKAVSSASMMGGNILVVIKTPEKMEPALFDYCDETTCFVLVSEFDKVPPALESVPASNRKSFQSPPFYKMEEWAADAVVGFARSRKCHIDGKMAMALVRKVGVDLGILDWEVDKAVRLARTRGLVELGADIIRDSMSPISSSDGSRLLDHLAEKNTVGVVKELELYRLSHEEDTIKICGKVLTPHIMRWLQAAHLDSIGMSPDVAAGRVGMNPWYWGNKVLPAARNWGVSGCGMILGVVARGQEAVFNGSVNPWIVLESGIIRLLISVTSP